MSDRFDCADPASFEDGLEAAVLALQSHRLVVLPTDTVYGVAADAFEPAAVRRLLRAKGRSRAMPPPVLVAAATTLDALASNIPSYAREMVEELWPGPLTLVCHQQSSLTWDLGDNRQTVAVRMPDDERALAVLRQTGPLAVSSANTTGHPAATTIEAAMRMLGDKVEVYLDAGDLQEPDEPGEGPAEDEPADGAAAADTDPADTDPADTEPADAEPADGDGDAEPRPRTSRPTRRVALPSTIVDVTGPEPYVLREGVLTIEELRRFHAHIRGA